MSGITYILLMFKGAFATLAITLILWLWGEKRIERNDCDETYEYTVAICPVSLITTLVVILLYTAQYITGVYIVNVPLAETTIIHCGDSVASSSIFICFLALHGVRIGLKLRKNFHAIVVNARGQGACILAGSLIFFSGFGYYLINTTQAACL